MKKRQTKKFMELYVLDIDDNTLVPPSICRAEARTMEKYFQKGWRISNPEQAKEIDAAIKQAQEEAGEKCGCGCGCECGCEHEHDEAHECNCGHDGCCCEK